MRKNKVAVWLLVLAVTVCASLWAGSKKKQKLKDAPAAAAQMDEHQRALHVLNRFTFGARPGDVDRVAAMGVEKWFEEQLHPEKIDDAALQTRLAPLRTLNMDERAMLENFPPPQVIKQVADGKMALPSDPTQRAIYQSQIERYQQRQENKAAKADVADPNQDPGTMTDEQRAQRRESRLRAREEAQRLLALTPDKRFQAILALPADERETLVRALSPDEREEILISLTPQQREQIMAMNNPQQVVATELMQGKILREAYSERQLEAVMTDFWYNHFNVFIGKGPDRYLITEYENKVIRPRALGKFSDLLVATAQSPAMLFYLDNWQSVGPDSPVGRGEPAQKPQARVRPMNPNRGVFRPRRFPPMGNPRQRPRKQPARANKQQRGLNENYARELMELHTLGVDGGYTQKDVTELARVLTGWTIQQPRRGGDYEFNERMHEPGAKVVLGHRIKEHGEKEGLEMLDILAHHPATARFISRKLAMRFVSDNPPAALVERMAATFRKSDGDIREVLRTMFRAPEFWAPETYRAKVKTPLEFVVSAIRASGADVRNAMPLVQTLNQMGMPLYGAQPPTGYSMKAETWVNASALLSRMNFALRFAAGRMPGVQFAPEQILAVWHGSGTRDSAAPSLDPQTALAQLESALLAGDVSKQTHETILKQLNDPQVSGRVLDDAARPPNVKIIAGLILGSPEFQRR